MPLIELVNQILTILTIIGQIIILALVISLFLFKNHGYKYYKNGIIFSLIVAIVATSGSLFYSEIAGYEPCKLCWFQRIFMYPQVILLGLSLKIRDKNIIYSLSLSIIGALISLYHNLLQFGFISETSCTITGTSCSKVFFMNLGYISIPMMSLTAFLLIILSDYMNHRYLKITKEKI